MSLPSILHEPSINLNAGMQVRSSSDAMPRASSPVISLHLPPPPYVHAGALLAGCDAESFDEWLDATLALALAPTSTLDEFDERMEELRRGAK